MKYLDPDKLRHLMWTPEEGIPGTAKGARRDIPLGSTLYQLMRTTTTYARGVYSLRKACLRESNTVHPTFVLDDGSNIYRPLTFRETIEARVNSYEQNKPRKKRLALFNSWNDSCTAAAYEQNTTRFRLVPISEDLITIPRNYNGDFLPIPYSSLAGKGFDLDSTADVYNAPLEKEKIPDHQGWRAALEDDVVLLRAYVDIVFAELNNPEKAMGFWVRQNTPTDELRALLVNLLGYYSLAIGSLILDDLGSFVRLAPSQKNLHRKWGLSRIMFFNQKLYK